MRTVVVTGGSTGIGRHIAQQFLEEGDEVFTVARRSMKPISSHHTHIEGDLSTWMGCSVVCSDIVDQTNRLDVLVNNVGKSEWRSIAKIDENFFANMMRLNVQSFVAMLQNLLPIMKNGSSVVNISSLAGKRGSASNSVYCATKFAVNGLTQSWAKELGPVGIRVNAVCPVLVRSEGLEGALVMDDAPASRVGVQRFLDEFAATQSALQRLPLNSEVAQMCVFLASNEASAITGQCINVDCGVLPQ